LPAFEELQVGETVDLGPPGTFVASEVRTARFVTGAGELPFDVEPGSSLRYVDLTGPRGQFATIDYGTGAAAETLYVGREVTLDELGMRGLPSDEERRRQARGEALGCPQCGGPLEIRAPDQTQRVACPYCGSLLDATKDLAVLQALARVTVQPVIPLGSRGRLDGVEWTVIGFMERSVTVEDVRYPWQEYLLYEPRKGFRWLVDSKGHWSFVEPLAAGDVAGLTTRSPRCRDVAFKHFQGGHAVVDHVLGEFYWAVARGDTTETDDYVHPPFMLSVERDASELNCSMGTYRKPREIEEAFGLERLGKRPQGVAPHQPWPWTEDARTVYRRAAAFVGLLVLLGVGFAVFGGRTVYSDSFAIAPSAVSGSPEAAVFAGPIEIPKRGNVQVKVKAPVSNSWLYLDGALINDETGEVDEFDVEVSYYHGTDSDGSWTEGGQSATRYIAAVAPGRYVLRLAPQWESGRPPNGYSVAVANRVPRFYHFVLAGLAVCAWPVLLAWRHMRFEMERWSESDHPWVQSE
jgi:hypothetical protein